MKDESKPNWLPGTFFFCHPSSFILHPSSFRNPGRVWFDRLAENLLDQGALALRPLRFDGDVPSSSDGSPLRFLLEEGYLEFRPDRTGQGTRLGVGARGVGACEERALAELLGQVSPAAFGHSPTDFTNRQINSTAVPGDDLRPHIPGEPLDHVDLHATLRNALNRRGATLPLSLHPDDLEVHPPEPNGQRSTVVLLDMSGSMVSYGKFLAARRTALALRGLVTRKFRGDRLRVAGFATRVFPLEGPSLLEAVPVPVGLVENRSTVRLPAALATGPCGSTAIPEHATNIQAALRWARTWLRTERSGSRQIVLITDGEPTAHLEGNELVLAYPPTAESVHHTLLEARRCAGEGIGLSIHALLTWTTSRGLREFVTDLARAGRGSAVCCPAGQLGRRVLRSFLHSRSQPR